MLPARRSNGSTAMGLVLAVAALMALAQPTAAVEVKDFPVVDIALFSAYIAEYEVQIELLSPPLKNYTYGGRLYTTGKIGNKSVVITMSGIGLVNAAMTTQQLITLFSPKYLLMSGIAGGIDPSVRIGDVVVAKTWFNPQLQKFIRPLFENGTQTSYFVDTAADFPDNFYETDNKTAGDFALTLPSAKSCGAKPPSSAYLQRLANTSGTTVSPYFSIPIETELLIETNDTFGDPTPPTKFFLPASNDIIKVASTLLPRITLEKTFNNASLPYQPTATVVERGMSSNTFLDNPDYRESVYALYKPSCVEMEGYAVMQVCLSNKVKCAVVRSISDLAGGAEGQQGENEIGVFFAIAALNTAKVSLAIITALP